MFKKVRGDYRSRYLDLWISSDLSEDDRVPRMSILNSKEDLRGLPFELLVFSLASESITNLNVLLDVDETFEQNYRREFKKRSLLLLLLLLLRRWVEKDFQTEKERVWHERVEREIGRKRGDLCLLPGWAWRCRVADGRSQPWGGTSHSVGWGGPPRRRPGSQARVINVWRNGPSDAERAGSRRLLEHASVDTGTIGSRSLVVPRDRSIKASGTFMIWLILKPFKSLIPWRSPFLLSSHLSL